MSVKTRFFGRETIIEDLVLGVLAPSQPLDFSLVGPKMIGKSRMLNYLAADDGPLKSQKLADMRPERFQDGQNVVVSHSDCQWPAAKSHLTQFIFRQLQLKLQQDNNIRLDWHQIEETTSPGQQIGAVVRQLEPHNMRLVLLLDNFDEVLQSDTITSDIINELRPLTNELGLIVATDAPLHDLNQTLAASPLFNVMHQHFVGLLEPGAVNAWIEAYSERVPLSAGVKATLTQLVGGHPFLLARINDIIMELQPFTSNQAMLNEQQLPLIRLRLAEHGRPLFESIWRRLKLADKKMTPQLLERLIQGPITLGHLPSQQVAVMNWLINQAAVAFDERSYYLFSPLFKKFLIDRLGLNVPEAELETSMTLPPNLTDIYEMLAPKEAELLRYFQANSNQVISLDQLLHDVWNQPEASPRRVQEAIRRLRNSLNKHTLSIGTIENERGMGYKFVPA